MLTPYVLAVLPQAAVIPDQPALVEVKHGRARLVAEEGTVQLTNVDPASVARGAAHLEVTAGSVVFVTWRGLATLRFEGPAAFEWSGETTGGELDWRVVDVASLEAEVRRGVARLELPMGWQVDFRSGAYHLRSLADGGTCVVHDAGEDLRIRWFGEHGPARPPAYLKAGQSARLASPPPLTTAPDRSVSAPAWESYEWPWGVHGIPGRPDLGAGPAWTDTAWPFGPASDEPDEPWTRVEWPWSAPEAVQPPERSTEPREPAPETSVAIPQAATEPLPEPVQAPVELATPIEEPAPVLEPASAAPLQPEAFQPEALQPEALQPEALQPEAAVPAAEPEPIPLPETPVSEPEAPVEPVPVTPPLPAPAAPQVVQTGPLRYRPHADLRVESLPDGTWTAALPTDATQPAQILGQRFDTWIQPGGTIHVDASGRLKYHTGPVEMRPSVR